jgi:hypothetical protein
MPNSTASSASTTQRAHANTGRGVASRSGWSRNFPKTDRRWSASELRTLMTRVRADVVAATNGVQRPELSDSLVGEFVFKAGP